jgi:hypothetical protein
MGERGADGRKILKWIFSNMLVCGLKSIGPATASYLQSDESAWGIAYVAEHCRILREKLVPSRY